MCVWKDKGTLQESSGEDGTNSQLPASGSIQAPDPANECLLNVNAVSRKGRFPYLLTRNAFERLEEEKEQKEHTIEDNQTVQHPPAPGFAHWNEDVYELQQDGDLGKANGRHVHYLLDVDDTGKVRVLVQRQVPGMNTDTVRKQCQPQTAQGNVEGPGK
ncbi:MAG: hypothetical protein M1822_006010 [Bathelium mastoideum]|nr:MAG: hypothetical protein M1822_006010 [Bathelium mastoideum]